MRWNIWDPFQYPIRRYHIHVYYTKFRKRRAKFQSDLKTPISRWALQWRHNGRDSVSNHQPHGCLLNRLFRRRSKKTSKLRVTGLCVGNSPGTGGFPAQMASNAENVSIWWRLHGSVFSNHFEIWQAARQHCRSTYQIWKQFEHYNLTGSKL